MCNRFKKRFYNRTNIRDVEICEWCHYIGLEHICQTASRGLLSTFEFCLKEHMCKALKASENSLDSLDQSSLMWHLIISCHAGLLLLLLWIGSGQWFVNGMAEPLWPTLYWHFSHLGSSSQMESCGPIIEGPQRPSSELSHSCLNGILIVSCLCVVFFFLFFSFPLECVSSLSVCAEASLDIYTTAVKPSQTFFTDHHGEGDIWNHLRRWAKRRRVSAVNKRPGRWTLLQAISVQSINFQDVCQKCKKTKKTT